MTTALFIDRDAVLVPPTAEPPTALLPGADAVLRRMRLAEVPVIVLGNLAPGTAAEAVATHQARLAELVAAAGGQLRSDRYAVEPEGHARRLPRPGLILEAAAEFGLDLASSWLVTAGHEGVAAAGQAGCYGCVLVGDAPDPGGFVAVRLKRARDLADAPRVMAPDGGGCWHEHS